jgi:hypothetical protein
LLVNVHDGLVGVNVAAEDALNKALDFRVSHGLHLPLCHHRQYSTRKVEQSIVYGAREGSRSLALVLYREGEGRFSTNAYAHEVGTGCLKRRF